jgi:hypothetical protein
LKVLRTSVTSKDNKIHLNSSTDVTSGSDDKGYGEEASISIPSSAFPNSETANETVYFVYYKTSKLFAPNYHRIEVCKDGFTSSEIGKVERRGTAYTVERVSSRVVTESSPVMSASLKGGEVVNLTEPVIIMFKLPPEMVRTIYNI